MAISSLTYDAPVRRPTRQSHLDWDKLEAASTLVEEGKPVESIVKVLEHFFPDRTLPDLSREALSFAQGSSRVTVKIDGDHLTATVPLVRLPTGGSAIAALRYVLTEIAASGQLYQPRLRGEDIHLEFRDRVSRFHPAKLVEVLRRMPAEADNCDDFLISQFSALPLEREPIQDLDEEELARSEKIWRQHWSDVEELFKECQRKRSVWFLNELTAFASNRFVFALPMCGALMTRVDAAASTFNDSNEDPDKREAALGKCVKEMKAVTGDVLRKNLGHATYALSPLNVGTPQKLSQYLDSEGYMETVNGFRKSAKQLDAALSMIGTYYYLLARFSWPEPVATELMAGLAQTSGKPWREAADILVAHAEATAAKFGDDDDDDDEDGDEAEGDEDEAEGDDA